MIHQRYLVLSVLGFILLLVPTVNAQELTEDLGTDKLAQTSFKFLKISPDARAAALGDAMTAIEMRSSMAMFYNPAGMARLPGQFSAGFSNTQWIADISYNAVSAAVNTGNYGVFGLSLFFAEYGEVIGTIRASNDQGFLEYSELGLANPSPSALSIGLGYAIAITDRFSVGANAKYVSQDLSEAVIAASGETTDNSESTIAFDFGVLYNTGFRSLNFALSVRNFSQEVTYVDENFELPLTFNVGVSMNLMDFTSMDASPHTFNLMVEAERPRDFSEQISVGGEYMFRNLLSLRAGYTFPTDEQGVSLGAGLQYEVSNIGVGVDYAFTTFGVFDNVQRVGVHLAF